MSEHWTERLSDYIDGDMDLTERNALETHLEKCVECSGTLSDLHSVVDQAQALEDVPPANDLWPGILSQIDTAKSAPEVISIAERREKRARRISFSVSQLAAASIALILLSGGSMWFLLTNQQLGTTVPTTMFAEAGSPVEAALVADASVDPFDLAVADLERILEASRDRLDPETVRAFEYNLAIIDRAIDETRDALGRDPENIYLNAHLSKNMNKKLQLLRDVTKVPQVTT